MKIKTIAVYGVGLIGGSIGYRVKDLKLPFRVLGAGRNIKHLKIALKKGAVHEIFTDYSIPAKKSDFIILAAHPSATIEIIKKIFPYLKKNAIITDVSSVRSKIDQSVNSYLKTQNKKYNKNIVFIGSHPMAGSEKKGIVNAAGEIFKHAKVFIIPFKYTDKKSVIFLKNFWEKLGCKPIVVSIKDHDIFVGYTSHLPHILSAAALNLVFKQYKINKNITNAIANSFRDLTRVSGSDPALWTDIAMLNRKNLSVIINKYIKSLKEVHNILKKGDSKKVVSFFSSAKKAREKLY